MSEPQQNRPVSYAHSVITGDPSWANRWNNPLAIDLEDFTEQDVKDHRRSREPLLDLYPFNASREEYEALLEREAYGMYDILIQVIFPWKNFLQFHDVWHNMVKKSVWKDIESVHRTIEESETPDSILNRCCHEVVIAPDSLADILGERQRDWATDGFYVQVGFAPAGKRWTPPALANVAIGLTIYDCLVERHNSMDPRDHLPLRLPESQALDLAMNMTNAIQYNHLWLSEEVLRFRDWVALECRNQLRRNCHARSDIDPSHGWNEDAETNFLGIPYNTHKTDE